jgi:pSer/pThr/pTyr-binding forkhead associated (FHA) protein
MPKIILKKKAEVLAEFAWPENNATCSIGSGGDNDVVVVDKTVSLNHLQLERRGGQHFVRDLKSAYGTFVNGIKINAVTEIDDGDAISVGEHTLLFRNSPGAPREIQNHTGGNAGAWNENQEAALEHAHNNSAEAPPRDFDSHASEPSESERLRRLHPQEEVELDSLEKELAEVIEQATPENKAEQTATNEAAGKSPYYLLAIHGPYLGKKFQLNFGETKIGRDARLNDIVIRENRRGEIDPSISRRHATISHRNNLFYLGDKRSKSRTYLNQDRLAESDELLLSPGDEIEIVSDQQSTIFRFVAEGNWDFSLPQKTGAWWLRHLARALSVGGTVITLLGLLTGAYAWYHRTVATDAPATLKMEYHPFAKVGAGGEEEAASESQHVLSEYAPLPVLSHLNGDDYTDIVFTHSDGTLSALSGKTRRRMWRISTIVLNRLYPATAADLNGNRKTDIVAITADGHLVAIDGLHGAEIWTSPFIANEPIGPPAVGNFDGDGRPDVAVVSVQGKLLVGYARLQEPEWVELDVGVIVQTPLSCADLDGDGDEEILVGTERGLVLIYDGSERRLSGSVNLNLSLNKLRGRFDESNQIRHPVSAADFTGDGQPDLLISSRQGNLVCVDITNKAADGAIKTRELWWNNLATPVDSLTDSLADSLADFSYPFVLGDVDADGLVDVIAVNDQGTISAFRGLGREGQKQPALWQARGGALAQPPALFDFDHDGSVEVVAAESNGSIKILNGKTGDMLWQERETIIVPREVPLLADLSDKAAVDILMVSADGVVHTFRSNRRVPAGTVIWGQRYGAATNLSALTVTRFKTGKWTALMLLSAVAIVAINATNFWVRWRRQRFAKGAHA